MPPRVKKIKREYADADAGDADYDAVSSGEDDAAEITMKITKKKRAPKKVKTDDGDAEGGARVKAKDENAPQKIGFDITAGPIQDEGLHAKYNAMNLDELKQYMKMNRMPSSEVGQKNKRIVYKKADLVAHCVDGEKWGRYPLCPNCGKRGTTTLRVTYADENHGGQGTWKCVGYYDTVLQSVTRCSFNYKEDKDAPRERLPWRKLGDEMSDDEQDDVQAGMDKPVVFPDDMHAMAPMEMSKKMVEICREHGLQLPKAENEALRECYTKLQASMNYDDEYDIKTAFNLLKEAYPPLTKEQQAGGADAKNPANTKLCQALEAIFQAAKTSPEEPMKSASYRKAAQSIREIDFEVTSGIAISKGKLKVPNVGPSLGAQIEFWIKNGYFERMEYYERGEIPPSSKK